MNFNNIFNIPERSIIDRKLTKAFFLKNFDLSIAEKKLLNNAIINMDWLASIKPSNANIPAVIDNNYVYEEIQLMVCTIGPNQLNDLGEKCIVLLQKYIPYQMVIVVQDEVDFMINVCDKRVNLNDTNKRTIEKYISTPVLSKLYKNEITSAFFETLNYINLDKTNLETTYKSYIIAIVQYQTATVTGTFNKRTNARTEDDMQALADIDTIEKELQKLNNQIKKETQVNSKVALNIEISNHKHTIESIKNKLGKP